MFLSRIAVPYQVSTLVTGEVSHCSTGSVSPSTTARHSATRTAGEKAARPVIVSSGPRKKGLERETGFEPATCSLEGRDVRALQHRAQEPSETCPVIVSCGDMPGGIQRLC